MRRAILATVTATLLAIAWGIIGRHDLAFGGEMILPAVVAVYELIRLEEERDEKESRKKRATRAAAKAKA